MYRCSCTVYHVYTWYTVLVAWYSVHAHCTYRTAPVRQVFHWHTDSSGTAVQYQCNVYVWSCVHDHTRYLRYLWTSSYAEWHNYWFNVVGQYRLSAWWHATVDMLTIVMLPLVDRCEHQSPTGNKVVCSTEYCTLLLYRIYCNGVVVRYGKSTAWAEPLHIVMTIADVQPCENTDVGEHRS